MSQSNLHAQTLQNLTPELSRSRQAWEALAQAGALITAAARAMLGTAGSPSGVLGPIPWHDDSCSVVQAVNEFLRAKARAGRSDRYLKELRVSLTSFARGKHNLALTDVTVGDLEKWLGKQNWAPRTQRGYLTDVNTLYNFAIKRGLASRNPAAAVELPTVEETPPALHTPQEVRTVLEFARSYDLNVCRTLAVRYFTGVRTAEANRMIEEDVKKDFVEVTAAKSKTRRRRLIPVQPNLRAWLDLGGVLPLHDVHTRFCKFVSALEAAHGIKWPRNVTRHSYVSYRLAETQNAGKTALEAGHTEPMLFSHYRELVTPAAAAEFWAIVPKTTS